MMRTEPVYLDLLEQARHLARVDAKKPRQANLRRAVSSAYYAIFHFLVDQACRGFMGSQQDRVAYRRALARGFEHSTMKSACQTFAGGTLPSVVVTSFPSTFQIPVELKRIAQTFAEAQEVRHLADYDLSERFNRSEVLGLIVQIESAIDGYRRVSDANVRQFFLVCLITWKALSKR